MFKGKTIIIGVTGGIAAYKIPNLVSMLVKQNCDIHVIMTENACNIITPLTFESLTKNKCIVDTFDRTHPLEVKHISLAKRADYMLIAPATANIIGKMANGIADDMLTTTFLACKCPIAVSPAMNTAMYENPIVQNNLEKLKSYGVEIIDSAEGFLACGDVGKGKLPEPSELYSYIEKSITYEKDLLGKKILVTAGATQESIDPVRFISNHSSGKMGFAIAKDAMLRGAEVTLVCGSVSVEPPKFVEIVNVLSAEEMFCAVKKLAPKMDIVVKSAAVADYTPVEYIDNKIKKSDGDMSIQLKRTTDILAYLGEHKTDKQFICGFSMETENLVENSKAKLQKKKIDMIVANNLKVEGAGFKGDTNIVTLITANSVEEFGKMSKSEVAHKLLSEIKNRL